MKVLWFLNESSDFLYSIINYLCFDLQKFSFSFTVSPFLSFCISVFLSFCFFVSLSFCLSVVFAFLSFFQSVFFLSFCLSVFLSFCLSVFLSFCLFVSLSFYYLFFFQINTNFIWPLKVLFAMTMWLKSFSMFWDSQIQFLLSWGRQKIGENFVE